MKRTLLPALALPFMLSAWADVIYMKDGTSRSGTFLSGTSGSITFRDEGGVQRQYNLRDVNSIEFGTTSQSTNLGTRGSRGDSSRDRIRTSTAAHELPAGTELTIRTNETIDSETSAEGRIYSAQVERDVTDSEGRIAIPRGARAELSVARVEDAGVVSESELTLNIRSLQIDGRSYLISTEGLEREGREGIGANRRTGTMVGGGAAVGAIIGAIAGGGKGALLGSIIGAVGGGAAQVMTKGKRVNVPAETVLTFRLDQPVRLEPIRGSLLR